MSNKTQLQINNTKYASLIETLRGKATGSSEDLDSIITELETKTTTLNTILEDKTSSGSGIKTTGITVSGFFRIYATIYADGITSAISYSSRNGTSIAIANAVSGSSLVVIYNTAQPDVTNATLIEEYAAAEIDEVYCYLYQVD